MLHNEGHSNLHHSQLTETQYRISSLPHFAYGVSGHSGCGEPTAVSKDFSHTPALSQIPCSNFRTIRRDRPTTYLHKGESPFSVNLRSVATELVTPNAAVRLKAGMWLHRDYKPSSCVFFPRSTRATRVPRKLTTKHAEACLSFHRYVSPSCFHA